MSSWFSRSSTTTMKGAKMETDPVTMAHSSCSSSSISQGNNNILGDEELTDFRRPERNSDCNHNHSACHQNHTRKYDDDDHDDDDDLSLNGYGEGADSSAELLAPIGGKAPWFSRSSGGNAEPPQHQSNSIFATAIQKLLLSDNTNNSNSKDYDDPRDSCVYMLGKTLDKMPRQRLNNDADNDADNDNDPWRRDECNLLWCTYRSNFCELVPYGYKTDSGWGCMLRASQMLLMQALRLHHVGRDWIPPPSHKIIDGMFDDDGEGNRVDECSTGGFDGFYRELLTWFADVNSSACHFSLHNMVACGLVYEKLPGEWYGPGIASHVLRDLCDFRLAQIETLKSRRQRPEWCQGQRRPRRRRRERGRVVIGEYEHRGDAEDEMIKTRNGEDNNDECSNEQDQSICNDDSDNKIGDSYDDQSDDNGDMFRVFVAGDGCVYKTEIHEAMTLEKERRRRRRGRRGRKKDMKDGMHTSAADVSSSSLHEAESPPAPFPSIPMPSHPLEDIVNTTPTHHRHHEDSQHNRRNQTYCKTRGNGTTINPTRSDDSPDWDRPLLLLIPLRLGLHCFNPIYAPLLARTMSTTQSVGFLGGRPRHAIWFYGASADGSTWYGLDPHTVQQAAAVAAEDEVEGTHKHITQEEGKEEEKRQQRKKMPRLTEEYADSFRSYRNNTRRRLGLGVVGLGGGMTTTLPGRREVKTSEMDPSLSLGFYFRNAKEFDDWCERMELMRDVWDHGGKGMRDVNCDKSATRAVIVPELFGIQTAKPNYEADVGALKEMMAGVGVSGCAKGLSCDGEEEKEDGGKVHLGHNVGRGDGDSLGPGDGSSEEDEYVFL